MEGVTQRLASLNRCGSVTYISWSSDVALYLEDYLTIYMLVNDLYFVSMILLNILKDIWWMNIIYGLMDQCDTKIDLIKYMQVFCGPVICLIS